MAKLTFPKSAMPFCAKPFTCRPLSLGVGVSPSSPGSQYWKAESSIISLSAAPSCANSSTSPSAFLNTKNPSILCSSLFLKPFDFQDRIYQARNDADKWTKCESLIGLDHSQLFLQRVDLALQGGNSCL